MTQEASHQEVQAPETPHQDSDWKATLDDGSPRCQGETRSGSQCARGATVGPYCKSHQPKLEAEGKPDDADVIGIDAADLLRGRFLKKMDDRKRAKRAELADELFYLACPVNHEHVGIIFTHNPKGRDIGPYDWYSVYKEPDQMWTFGNDMVICQECYVDGIHTPLRVGPPSKTRNILKDGAAFRIADTHQRFIRKMGKDKVQELLAAGESAEVTRG